MRHIQTRSKAQLNSHQHQSITYTHAPSRNAPKNNSSFQSVCGGEKLKQSHKQCVYKKSPPSSLHDKKVPKRYTSIDTRRRPRRRSFASRVKWVLWRVLRWPTNTKVYCLLESYFISKGSLSCLPKITLFFARHGVSGDSAFIN